MRKWSGVASASRLVARDSTRAGLREADAELFAVRPRDGACAGAGDPNILVDRLNRVDNRARRRRDPRQHFKQSLRRLPSQMQIGCVTRSGE